MTCQDSTRLDSTHPPYFKTVISGIAAPNGKLLPGQYGHIHHISIGIGVLESGEQTYVPAGAKNPSFSFPGSVTFFKHPSASWCYQSPIHHIEFGGLKEGKRMQALSSLVLDGLTNSTFAQAGPQSPSFIQVDSKVSVSTSSTSVSGLYFL